jgi:hypothetical protein
MWIAEIVDRLQSDLSELIANDIDSLLLLAGDFITPKLNKFAADNGLSQIVNAASHGVHTLDHLFGYSWYSYIRHV